MKRLVLLGAGYAHLEVLWQLAKLARKAPLPFTVTLVSPYSSQIHASMLPAHLLGRYTLSQCSVPLQPLVAAVGAQHVLGKCVQIDASQRVLQISDGRTRVALEYDLLSVATGPVQDRERIESDLPGAKAHAVFVRPLEAFLPRWSEILQSAQSQALRLAVVGAGAAGIELALAIKQRLPHCAMALVSAASGPAATYPEPVRQRLWGALRDAGVSVLPQSCVAIAAQHLTLSGAATLSCDHTLLALPAQAPRWLAGSGLGLDANGFIQVNSSAQSVTHPEVFAAGDVASRVDLALAKSSVYAIQVAPVLAHNLVASLTQQALRRHVPAQHPLHIFTCGPGAAVAAKGRWSVRGRIAWLCKDWADRRWVARYTLA